MATDYAVSTVMMLADRIEEAKEMPMIVGMEAALDIRSVVASLILGRHMIAVMTKQMGYDNDVQIDVV